MFPFKKVVSLFIFFGFFLPVFSIYAGKILYEKDIAPIIQKKCAPCHHQGQAAPFQLLNYQEVSSHAKMISFVVANRIMPPWPADPSYSHFINEKILRKGEIDTLLQWVNTGMLAGDTSYLKTIVFENAVQDKPDLVVKMKRPLSLKGDNKDRFYVMKFPVEVKRDTFLKSIEFHPGNVKIVHHMNAHLLRYETGKKRTLFEGESLIQHDESSDMSMIHQKLALLNDDGSYPTLTPSVCNYLPGMNKVHYPKGIGGYSLNKKSTIYLNDIHYGPTPIDEIDSSYFNLYYGTKPERPTAELILGTLGRSAIVPEFIIPADSVKKFKTELQIQSDISILSINPHMHLIGKVFYAYAISPQGDTIPLIRIPQWNFRWQYVYTFPSMLKIVKGSRIIAEGIFDNTNGNIENPYHPPRKITGRNGSMKTTEEMFQFIITYLPYHAGDEKISLE